MSHYTPAKGRKPRHEDIILLFTYSHSLPQKKETMSKTVDAPRLYPNKKEREAIRPMTLYVHVCAVSPTRRKTHESCNNYRMPTRAIPELLHQARGPCAIIFVLHE